MDDWRAWLDDMLGFFEASNPGMRDFLKALASEDAYPDDVWCQRLSVVF